MFHVRDPTGNSRRRQRLATRLCPRAQDPRRANRVGLDCAFTYRIGENHRVRRHEPIGVRAAASVHNRVTRGTSGERWSANCQARCRGRSRSSRVCAPWVNVSPFRSARPIEASFAASRPSLPGKALAGDVVLPRVCRSASPDNRRRTARSDVPSPETSLVQSSCFRK